MDFHGVSLNFRPSPGDLRLRACFLHEAAPGVAQAAAVHVGVQAAVRDRRLHGPRLLHAEASRGARKAWRFQGQHIQKPMEKQGKSYGIRLNPL